MDIKTIAKKQSNAAHKFSENIQVEVTIINTDDEPIMPSKHNMVADKSKEIRRIFSKDK